MAHRRCAAGTANWGLASLMRPARAAPGVPFVNLPLRQSPNACAGDCRGIFDPVVPYKPPRLTAHLTCSNLALAVVNMTSNCNGEIQPACDLRATNTASSVAASATARARGLTAISRGLFCRYAHLIKQTPTFPACCLARWHCSSVW